eukprot:gene10996-7824_t
MKASDGASAAGKKAKPKTIEQTYTKMTQLEHILLRPDTYIGSIDKQTQQMWVYDSVTKKMVNRQVTYVPGLFKIFDEIIVNAADNKQRDPTMSRLDVTIDVAENKIRVWNNGRGIPVAIHQDHDMYVAELIFGHLLTGSNFDDDEEKTTGGRNGYGAKLANIFSTKFIVETADSSRGLKYSQEFRKNMSVKTEPKITSFSGTDYTCITFYPDLRRFKMDELDDDIFGILAKRVYDIAATNLNGGAKLKVTLNGEKLDVHKFEQYLELFEGIEPPVYCDKLSDRWQVGVGMSDGSFQHISFVNSISTTKGGTHVNFIADKIVARLVPIVKKRNKGEEVKANQIKNHLAIFVNALIVNPAFDSQTKENLTTKASSFGSTCEIPDKLIKAIEKSPIIENILSWSKLKQTQELKRKSGTKTTKRLHITKLDDANYAGTSKSSKCTLILTEGDSAKALAISGLGVVGRDYYGVFPLRGKLLNVREATHKQMMNNEEIQNITKILGLTFGKTYDDSSSLRYGHLMIMTDQDHDGSHIKGLLINFLHFYWPSLLRIEGFLQQFITPIVKVSKGKSEVPFYTIPEYRNWKESHHDGKGWKIKYYKGLGTSTAAEAKDYFSNLATHEIDFRWDAQSDDMIEMAFSKKRVEDRKLWLLAMEPGVHIDYKAKRVTYDNFVNHELILFSHADNERSIAHFMDGMKPSQRKVLFACFKRNLKQEIKVAQLAGYVSEHSAYHHGEASLTQTIIGMAQNFVGSNNINLLSPCGQFGTRLMGGKDAASPRYVFTKLETITRLIFHPDDDPLLEYLEDDGQSIEPLYYVPIIPMALVNGCEGIGTGWSSSVPTFNPRELISNLKRMIQGDEPEEMLPWYRGFTGSVQQKAAQSYVLTGTLEQLDEQTVRISELPVGKWTTDYKQYLESVLVGNQPTSKDDKDDGHGATATAASSTSASAPFVKDFKENHTDTSVLFTITTLPDKLDVYGQEKGGLIKKFKLDTSVSTSNMHLFDLGSKIKKYDGPMSLLREFFHVRLFYYTHRKTHLLGKLTNEWDKLDNKVRFLLAVIRGDIVVANRKKTELLNDLKRQGLKTFYEAKDRSKNNNEDGAAGEGAANDDDADTDEATAAGGVSLERGYDYLLSLKLWNLTMEKVHELTAQRNEKRQELDELMATSAEALWLRDLETLEVALDDFDATFDEAKASELAAQKKAQRHRQARGKAATASARKGGAKGGGAGAKRKVKKDAAGAGADSGGGLKRAVTFPLPTTASASTATANATIRVSIAASLAASEAARLKAQQEKEKAAAEAAAAAAAAAAASVDLVPTQEDDADLSVAPTTSGNAATAPAASGSKKLSIDDWIRSKSMQLQDTAAPATTAAVATATATATASPVKRAASTATSSKSSNSKTSSTPQSTSRRPSTTTAAAVPAVTTTPAAKAVDLPADASLTMSLKERLKLRLLSSPSGLYPTSLGHSQETSPQTFQATLSRSTSSAAVPTAAESDARSPSTAMDVDGDGSSGGGAVELSRIHSARKPSVGLLLASPATATAAKTRPKQIFLSQDDENDSGDDGAASQPAPLSFSQTSLS